MYIYMFLYVALVFSTTIFIVCTHPNFFVEGYKFRHLVVFIHPVVHSSPKG